MRLVYLKFTSLLLQTTVDSDTDFRITLGSAEA